MDSQDRNNLWHYTDSSKNPYYNQPTSSPYLREAFATASLVLGSVSLLSACTFLFPIPLGALGIFFAAMAYRKGKKLHYMAKLGVFLSGIGIFCCAALITAYMLMIPALLKNEEFRRQLDITSQRLYGVEYEELIKDIPGFTIE